MESGTSGGQGIINKENKKNHEVERGVVCGGGVKYIQGGLL
jgi:hypothetical protein